MNTSITAELYLDFLNCRYKAFLKATGTPGTTSDFQAMDMTLNTEFAHRARQHLRGSLPADQVSHAPQSLAQSLQREYPIITDAHATVGDLSVRLHALVRIPTKSSAEYIPVLFVHREKLVRYDKLLLALSGLCLQRMGLPDTRFGKIIHGDLPTTTRACIDTLIPSVEHDLLDIACLFKGNTGPKLRLNSHCSVCEFREHCRSLALENDDLSLLRTLKDRDLAKLNAKGIFTTTQLSYNFRPRRKRKNSKKSPLKHHHSLQALAIRTDTIYVAQKPEVPQKTRCFYLDIEGVPDRDFYYLIGLRMVDGGSQSDWSFWADRQDDERTIWESFLRAIETVHDCTIFHYGSYDSRAIGHLSDRYGGDESLLERLSSSCVNVLSLVYGHVYFPTYSNGLKSIASCLDFKWTDADSSGLQSLVWRHHWEANSDEIHKRKLTTYNQEDCIALQVVTDALYALCDCDSVSHAALPKETVDTQTLARGWPNIYKRNAFYFPALDRINRCAYFNYQRERVYVRTSKLVKQSIRRKNRKRRSERINRTVEWDRPSYCPRCASKDVVKHQAISKTVHDLKFFSGGVKRWTINYTAHRYICQRCRKTFLPESYPSSHFGHNLGAWVVYQNIGLLRSYNSIVEELRELFGYEYPGDIASRFKSSLASYYEPTFRQLLERIQSGRLIHADETKASVKGRTGYVWTFTNLEEVVYIFTETREGTVLEEILGNFGGVLVSDFYAAYDSVECDQQKCLIHLIRDVNDDLFKNPFDDDLKVLGAEFTNLLVPIIETVDKYGLKKRHLNKHREQVRRFFASVSSRQFSSEIARGYQRRLGKYEKKLFTFLEYDGVPWNNNNAENAVKRFAFLRRVIGGSSTGEGLKEYLILLSIRETLRRKSISFLEFLLAREPDLDRFLAGR